MGGLLLPFKRCLNGLNDRLDESCFLATNRPSSTNLLTIMKRGLGFVVLSSWGLIQHWPFSIDLNSQDHRGGACDGWKYWKDGHWFCKLPWIDDVELYALLNTLALLSSFMCSLSSIVFSRGRESQKSWTKELNRDYGNKINVHMFWLAILWRHSFGWQFCKAHYLQWQIANFLI
jgi:hypothetical protein